MKIDSLSNRSNTLAPIDYSWWSMGKQVHGSNLIFLSEVSIFSSIKSEKLINIRILNPTHLHFYIVPDKTQNIVLRMREGSIESRNT